MGGESGAASASVDASSADDDGVDEPQAMQIIAMGKQVKARMAGVWCRRRA
jgi:hypothetical protein